MILDQSRDQGWMKNDHIREIKVSVLSANRTVGKHLVFSSIIDGNENNLSLIDNGSEAEILNESFAQERKLKIVKLKRQERVRLVLGDGSTSQLLKEAAIIKLKIGEHEESLFCYLAKIEGCTLILGDGWLQKHNPTIN